MAEQEQDRSEKPTTYKLRQARQKGNVARGMDLGFMAGLAGMLGYMWVSGPELGRQATQAARIALTASPDGNGVIYDVASVLAAAVAGSLLVMAGVIFVVVLFFEFLQTGLVFTFQPLKPDFSRLNPATGLKRLFSLRLLIETLKSIAKFVAYAGVSLLLIKTAVLDDGRNIVDASSLAAALIRAGTWLLIAILLIALAFALFDQLIARRDYLKRMRMSRRELRREHRDREGDSRLKQKRKQLHGEFVKLSQSLRGLRGADVLITNPTHIAFALRYDRKTMAAPVAVSIGVNRVAQRLKRDAFLYNIPIVENRDLARKLLASCKLNEPIPEHCFQDVAGVYNALARAARAEESAAPPEPEPETQDE